MTLRIGVNALYLIPGGVGGTEIYLTRLLEALAAVDQENRYFVFTNRETPAGFAPAQENFEAVPQPVRAANRPARILWEQTGLAVAAARHRLDVMFNPGFTAPLLAPCANVTVFHDLQHKRHPEHFRWFDLPFWRALLYGVAHRSRKLIAVSDATRDDLMRYYGLESKRIAVVPHGVEEAFFEIGRERSGSVTEPFLLCVSTLHPHKNLDRLIQAFAIFRRRRPDFRLIIAGLRGFAAEELEKRIESLAVTGSVILPGWIPREDLYNLYRRAHAFVYPSTFEGFGMPVLEAMAAAIPLACSNIEPLFGISGGAARMFDPDDVSAIADALTEITENEKLRWRLTVAGPARAREVTWERAAYLTLDALRS
jgi:glycosyltransferase involved in cell wall biosynthesis